MKLFFKHILRSIKLRPLQPFMLILTLALSVTVSVCSLALRSSIMEEPNLSKEAELGNADIKITLNNNADSRFMFSEDAEKILGEECRIAGYYELFLSDSGSDMLPAAAVDFDSIGEIFQFEFISYGGVDENTRDFSVFISESFAKSHGLSVGDDYKAELLGTERSYKIAGIAKSCFIDKFDIILDISGVIKVITAKSPFAAALGEDFRPCNTLLIDLPEDGSIALAIEKLQADEAFADKSISDVSERENSKTFSDMLFTLINFAIILSCIISAAVAYSCFSIISAERREENCSFSAAGACSALLNAMQYAEASIYWFFGSLLGIILSIPATALMNKIIGFKYADISITPENLALSSAFLLISVILSVSAFILTKNRKKASMAKRKLILPLFILCTAVYILTFILPLSFKLSFGMASAILLLLLLFLSSGALLIRFIGFICKIGERTLIKKRKIRSTAFYYSLKNINQSKILHGTVRMLALLIGAVLCIGYTVNSLNGQIHIAKNIIDSEYAVLNAGERCYTKLTECESISSVERLYISTAKHEKGMTTTLISATDTAVLGNSAKAAKRPAGNEAVISEAEAKALSLEEGDSFTVILNNTEIDLTVKGTVRSGLSFVLFDCEHFGIDYTVLLPSQKSGSDTERYLSDLAFISAEEVAVTVKSETLLENMANSMGTFKRSGNLLLASISLFSIIGIVNTYIECYRSRKNDFAMYKTAGMSKRKIKLMKLSEIGVSAAFSLLIGFIGFLIILPAVNEAMLSACYDVYENFAAWVKSLKG